MKKEEILEIMYGKEKWEVYRKFELLESSIDTSNELYDYFDEFLNMLKSEKSYVKVRAFRIICNLSKWDVNNKIEKNVNLLLSVINDEKPTNVRQYLKVLNTLILYKPNLIHIIKEKIKEIDCTKYKDTMSSLIKKDIEEILKKV